ncbi:MAG TPA: tRNA pseudouridine(55) synthase TruB [Actinomycetota bacterium]|nr:tRNA pseudouridine(55) synthase TruB [Actinomycetota bacterium]
MDGVLVCDKPAGMTSHDVVARVRRLAGQRRVGHGGTLDPPATGVLVLALGRATRLLPFLPMEPKRYLARIAFGAETDTLDASGTVTATADAAGVDEPTVRGALGGFLGPQEQVPPMVSAVKVGGERLYAKARRGESVERAARPIVVHALELVDFAAGERPEATVAVTCSGGTYVRSLAADLGRALGTLAHLAGLRRTAVGQFTERDAHTLPALEALATTAGGLGRVVLAPAQALQSIAVRSLSAAEAAALATGATLPPSGHGEPVAAVAPDGRLVAVIQDDAGRARSRVVLG